MLHSPKGYKFWVSLLLLCLAAALPTLYLFKGDSYWFDEVFSLSAVREPVPQLIEKWMVYDVHPPLYYSILWCWIRIVGESEIATRSLSLFFYLVALLAYAYYMRRQSFAVFVLGLLTLMNPYVMYYALEVRGYSLLFALTSIFCFRYVAIGRLDTRQTLLLSLVALCHFFGFVVSCSFCLAHLILNWPRKDNFRPVVLKSLLRYTIALLPAFLYYAWLISLGHLQEISGGKFWIQSSLIDAVGLIVFTIVPFSSLHIVLFLSGLAGLVLLLRPANIRTDKVALLFALQIIIASVVLVAINLHTPIFHRRYLLHFIPISVVIILAMIRKNDHSPKWQKISLGVFAIGMTVAVVDRCLFQLNRKTAPVADIRAQSAFIAKAGMPVFFVVPEVDERYFSEYMYSKMSNYYLLQQGNRDQQKFSKLVYWSDVSSLPRPALLQFINDDIHKTEKQLRAAGVKNHKIVPFAKVYGSGAFCVELEAGN